MLTSKKDLESLQEQIQTVIKHVQDQNIEVAKLKDANNELTEELDDTRNLLTSFKEQFAISTESLGTVSKALNNEVVEFKLFISKNKKDLVNDLHTEFSREMKNSTDGILQDLESFRRLKDRINILEKELSEIHRDVIKFVSISEKIKEADFDLVQYKRVLEQGDKEKLELLRRIDSLERLVAKIRRH